MKRKERGNSLIGLFVPQKWHQMRPFVKCWEPHLCGLSKGKKPEELVWLEFDFSRLYKADIYRDLARAVIHSWLQVGMKELAIYLAERSNLSDNADVFKRIDTIYRMLKHYKKKIKKVYHGTVDFAA